jgi:hypothetical protein
LTSRLKVPLLVFAIRTFNGFTGRPGNGTGGQQQAKEQAGGGYAFCLLENDLEEKQTKFPVRKDYKLS